MAAGSIYFMVIFMIPIYGLFMWMYFEPEESIRSGRRWMYKEDPEITEAAIRYTKFSASLFLIGMPVLLACTIVNMIWKIHLLRILLIVIPILLIIVFVVGATKILSADEK